MTSLLSSFAQRTLAPILQRILDRARWWPLGIFPLRASETLQTLRVHDTSISLTFPSGELERQQWELKHLFQDDPYQLRLMPQGVQTVMDIGGNIGLFSILARHFLPESTIHCYEPNPALQTCLKSNTSKLNISVFSEGVGGQSGKASMDCGGQTLEGATVANESGGITITSIAEAI